MFNSLKILLLIISSTLILTSKANAYFDPGTGSYIIQAILGFLAAGLATMTMMWSKFKIFLSKIFKKNEIKEEEKDKDIKNK
tara:strand:+ start:1784 stop:2029 length:246 start_codon:yes stop_codon:yes gene_type:complete